MRKRVVLVALTLLTGVVGDTLNPVREHYQVQQDQTYEYTLTLPH